MNYTGGEWKERMVMGERQIYTDKENGEIEVIARDVRHWNAPIIKASPKMYAKLQKVCKWLDKNAEVAEKQARESRFITIREGAEHDAKNYRAIAKDLRTALPPD